MCISRYLRPVGRYICARQFVTIFAYEIPKRFAIKYHSGDPLCSEHQRDHENDEEVDHAFLAGAVVRIAA